jgi:glutamyl-tRNA synthetase
MTHGLLTREIAHDATILPWKKSTKEESRTRLQEVRDLVASWDESVWTSIISLEGKLREEIAERRWGNGDTLWPLRVALSGAAQSPSPFDLLFVLGKDWSLARIDAALAILA